MSDVIDDGGPAFPGGYEGVDQTGHEVRSGMSLRDWFAGIEVEGDKATVTLHSTRESVLTEWAHKRMDEGASILRAKVDGTRLTITQSEGGNDD